MNFIQEFDLMLPGVGQTLKDLEIKLQMAVVIINLQEQLKEEF